MTDLALLDVLSRLPVGVRTPTAGMSAWELESLAAVAVAVAVAVAATVDATSAIRLLRPPLEVVGVEVAASGGWRASVRRAAALAVFARTVVVLATVPRR